jgi:hypothetical protein
MADHSSAFLLVTILAFITIILIFGMKYFSAGRTARLQAAHDGDLTADLADIKRRLATIEKILKEVE